MSGKIRWINTAGFDIEMANGKHILIDPFISGATPDGITCYPMSIDDLEGCDYLILSHTHIDHAADVGRIQRSYPKLNLFTGDLSADALCEEQDLDCARLYRVRSGEVYEFDDLKIEVFSGRHTESSKGYRRTGKDFIHEDGSFWPTMWYGNLEFLNYRLTLCDGTVIFVWGGMTSPDQKYKFRDMRADIALMHVSPKQSFAEFAELVHAIRTRIVIPHHYDFTEVFFEAVPAVVEMMSEENKKRFVRNGKFRMDKYLDALGDAVSKASPETVLMKIDHHRWYTFGFSLE